VNDEDKMAKVKIAENEIAKRRFAHIFVKSVSMYIKPTPKRSSTRSTDIVSGNTLSRPRFRFRTS